MNDVKGLSQILYLIIAASVLMIAALSLVFMLDEGMSGIIEFGGDADSTACERALQSACAGMDGDHEPNIPNTCERDGETIPPAQEGQNCAFYGFD